MTELALMKLDVLGRFNEILVAEAYEIDGQHVPDFPVDQLTFQKVKPIYNSFPGWKSDIMNITRYEDLPIEARNYVEWIEVQIEIPISLVSVGPGREQTLLRG